MFIERYKFVDLLKEIHKSLNLIPNTISILELKDKKFFEKDKYCNKVYFAIKNNLADVTELYVKIKNLDIVKEFETKNNANLILDRFKDKPRLVVNY